MVFHSSRISLSRSPADFHPVDSAAIFSASSTRAVLRASASPRATSRAARASPAFSSATAASRSSRVARPSMSPTTCASASVSRIRLMLVSECDASAAPDFSRASMRSTSVTRSANRRAKCASPSSGGAACQEPTTSSPSAGFTYTVPSASTRPKAVQSFMIPSSFFPAPEASMPPTTATAQCERQPSIGILSRALSQVQPGYGEAPADDRDHMVSYGGCVPLQPVPRVIAVVGPTAAGKSALGIALAQELGGEVVNADSMQLYRGMDIGTAKLSLAQRDGVPHHVLDIWDVTEPASVAEYQKAAR